MKNCQRCHKKTEEIVISGGREICPACDENQNRRINVAHRELFLSGAFRTIFEKHFNYFLAYTIYPTRKPSEIHLAPIKARYSQNYTEE